LGAVDFITKEQFRQIARSIYARAKRYARAKIVDIGKDATHSPKPRARPKNRGRVGSHRRRRR